MYYVKCHLFCILLSVYHVIYNSVTIKDYGKFERVIPLNLCMRKAGKMINWDLFYFNDSLSRV